MGKLNGAGRQVLALQLLLGDEEAVEAEGDALWHGHPGHGAAAEAVRIVHHKERLLLELIIHECQQVAIILTCDQGTKSTLCKLCWQ